MASVAISIALLTLTKDLRPAKEVFSNVTDGSNWNSKGFSFMIGFLSVAVRIFGLLKFFLCCSWDNFFLLAFTPETSQRTTHLLIYSPNPARIGKC